MRDYAELVKALREDAKWAEKIGATRTAKRQSDAADAIEELIAKLKANENSGRLLAAAFERLKEKVPKWISVDERLPEKSGRTIVYLQEPNGIKHVSFAQFQKNLVRWDLNSVRRWWRVTHWMPLPAPPKEDAE